MQVRRYGVCSSMAVFFGTLMNRIIDGIKNNGGSRLFPELARVQVRTGRKIRLLFLDGGVFMNTDESNNRWSEK